ncbi:MAG: FtsQ-type POTRA domain-containing protein [Candidatus Acidiferrales bacterium]
MDADTYPQEVLADEEPKYLRRQKPLEIKRRKFGRKAWMTYLRVAMWIAIAVAGLWVSYVTGRFLLASPEMALVHPEQIELAGNHYVQRASVLAIFSADRGHSVLRIPLAQRRHQLEAIPWVEQATVRRALPNKIEIEITERTPVAFLRQGSELSLLDIHGVILERPIKGNFHFPVITGISADLPQDDRERRMLMFAGFTQQAESARPGAMEQVSEVDLSDANDLRATITGLPGGNAGGASGGQADAPVLVHFGDGDFLTTYRTLLADFPMWRAKAGRVESVDLRFNGQAVVNPDTQAGSQQVAEQRPPKPAPAKAAKKSPAKKPK